MKVGTLVAVANETNHVTLVDLRTGSRSHVLREHKSEVMTLAWSLNNPRLLATGGNDGKVNIWDVRKARSFLHTLDYNNVRFKAKSELKMAGISHHTGVYGLAFSPCGRYILSLGGDKRIRKWDTMTWKNLKTKFQEVSLSRSKAVDLVFATGLNCEKMFVPENNTILIIDTSTGRTDNVLTGHFRSVISLSFNSFRLELNSGGKDRKILSYDGGYKADKGRDVEITADSWSSDEEIL